MQSSNTNVLTVDSDGVVRALATGTATLSHPFFPEAGVVVTVEDSFCNVLKIDPLLASIRLQLAALSSSRFSPSNVLMQVFSRLFYFQETVELTASAVLTEGHRIIVSPFELFVTSSNHSIVSVDGHRVTAEDVGVVTLTVEWRKCDTVFASALLNVTVTFDLHRPVFEPSTDSTTVPESLPLGRVIYTAMANEEVDSTGGALQDLRYLLQFDPYNQLFLLDPVSGNVTTSIVRW